MQEQDQRVSVHAPYMIECPEEGQEYLDLTGAKAIIAIYALQEAGRLANDGK